MALHPPLDAFEIGAGTSAWGDTHAWHYGRAYRDADLRAAFDASIAAGVRLFDTAEIYGFGRSESLLGRFVAESGQAVSIATKFFPYPWRVATSQLLAALRASLARLGVDRVALYQVHWPIGPRSPAFWMEPLAAAVAEGLVQDVGVSNYSASQLQTAFEQLAARGVKLASNQVEYSLLRRGVESSGVLDACRELNVRLVAYRPLAAGRPVRQVHRRRTAAGRAPTPLPRTAPLGSRAAPQAPRGDWAGQREPDEEPGGAQLADLPGRVADSGGD